MKIKNILLSLGALTLFFGVFALPARAYALNDSFDELRLNIWEPAGTLNNPLAVTNWHIDNGTLLQDTGIDGAVLFVKDREFSDLVTSFDMRQIWQSAGMAFVFWYQDRFNMSSVVAIPGMQLVVIGQVYNGIDTPIYYWGITNMHDGGDWYNMKAEIDSATGVVKVYIGGELVVTHTMTTPLRSGKFALETGNAGGWFDNFNLTDYTTPVNKDECKKEGWKLFNNPTFANQRQCEKYVKDHKENGKVKGGLQMSNPSQKIKFNLSEKEISDSNYHKGKHQQVEYWNYDYPGVLHYKANALCVNVDKTTKEARFMFQIPNGWPGLTGLYVVSYAKDINQKRKPDLYGHSATSDLAIATTWCETGIGFSPTMYPVTKGEVEVK